jgi:hypothetical protein
VLFRLAERSIGWVSTVILARLLVPADFGLIAMAMSIIAVLELLGAFGFDMALIQNPNAAPNHYDTACTSNSLGDQRNILLEALRSSFDLCFFKTIEDGHISLCFFQYSKAAT